MASSNGYLNIIFLLDKSGSLSEGFIGEQRFGDHVIRSGFSSLYPTVVVDTRLQMRRKHEGPVVSTLVESMKDTATQQAQCSTTTFFPNISVAVVAAIRC